MNKYLGTSICVGCCDKMATFHGGHVMGKDRMALGNLVDIKILAGWCSEECYNSHTPDKDGCYGNFNRIKMGPVKDCFEEMFGKKQ